MGIESYRTHLIIGNQAYTNLDDVKNGNITTFTAEVQVEVPNRVNAHTHQFLNFRQVVTTFNLMEKPVGSHIMLNNKIVHLNVTTTIRIERGMKEWRKNLKSFTLKK
ncbi:MAG: hypothetical protein WBP74_12215 [Nitrososphaeraceae archaeon]